MNRSLPAWLTVTAVVALALVFMAPSQVVLFDASQAQAPPAGALSQPAARPAPSLSGSLPGLPSCSWCASLLPPNEPITCTVESFVPVFSIFGPGCEYNSIVPKWEAFAASVESTSAINLMNLLGNSLNITNAFVANLNATMQELLSYYENRAEAIVGYFLNTAWNATTYDQIAIDSGLIPAIEGMEFAIATQEYQEWNATQTSWENLFGPAGGFSGYDASLIINNTGFAGTGENNTLRGPIVFNGQGFNMTFPFETWAAATATGFSDPTFFNLMPGGTIVCVENYYPGWANCPTYTVYDLTKGTNFTVPAITRTHFINATGLPIESTLNNIGTFDLLKLECTASCSDTMKFVEVAGGYAFRNISVANPNYPPLSGQPGYAPYEASFLYDTMVPELAIATPQAFIAQVPSLGFTLCIHEGTGSPLGTCSTPKISPQGESTGFGSGPNSVAGSNDSFTGFAQTMQSLVNNTVDAAHILYLTLRAVTDNGKYQIPADCAIPLPSAALPASIFPGSYELGTNESLALYWGYLNAVGIAYDRTPFHSLEFCGDPHLGLNFNWSGSWKLRLNITASIYIGNANGTGSGVNGVYNSTITYSNPSTWSVVKVLPTLLFPYEYETDIPVNTTYPIPFNDPLAALLVNYSGNLLYGDAGAINQSQAWGIPTYLTLSGYGNAIYPTGAASTQASGRPNDTGDALNITRCVLLGVPQATCNFAVTYFNNFTYGHVTGLVGPTGPPSNGGSGLGALGNDCGFGALNQWYDGWAGYLGSVVADGFSYFGNAVNGIPVIGGGLSSLINGVGCLIAWIVVILVVLLFFYIIVKVVEWIWPRRRTLSGGRGGGSSSRGTRVIVEE